MMAIASPGVKVPWLHGKRFIRVLLHQSVAQITLGTERMSAVRNQVVNKIVSFLYEETVSCDIVELSLDRFCSRCKL